MDASHAGDSPGFVSGGRRTLTLTLRDGDIRGLDQPIDRLDLDDAELEVLARRLGHEGSAEEARRSFIAAFRQVREDVRSAYVKAFRLDP